MIKILLVFGTRPEAIKMAPLVKALKLQKNIFDTKVCVTAQHREMLDQVLGFFNIIPDYDLDLMKPGQNLYDLTSNIILEFKKVLENYSPDYVFVHGDTTTTCASSLASFYYGAKVCHIEAGLRTYNKNAPFPEEVNRQITSCISDYHFAPTERARENLINENKPKENIIVTGNTVIDALFTALNQIENFSSDTVNHLKGMIGKRDVVLVTGHRRENHGEGFINICEALREIAISNKDLLIIYPVHLNPNVRNPVNSILGQTENVILIDPLGYEDFVWLMNRSKLIITDSGGVQEEAPSLGKPVLVMRETTERPEAVESGTVILVGTEKTKILEETFRLLKNKQDYEEMSIINNPYGDGKACERIVKFIKKISNQDSDC